MNSFDCVALNSDDNKEKEYLKDMKKKLRGGGYIRVNNIDGQVYSTYF